MGLFQRKDKHIYGDYSDDVIKENYSLSDEGILPIGKRQDINRAPHALTPDEVKGGEPLKPATEIPMHSAGESLYKKMMDARKGEKEETDSKSEEVKKQTESLLHRCSQFVTDDKNAPILTSQPAYKLDSVESIIAEAERKAQERVKKIYGNNEPKKDEASAPAPTEPAEKTESEDIVSSSAPLSEDKTVEGLRLPNQQPEDIPMERVEVKNYQYRFADEDRDSDKEDGATITFAAIKEAPVATEKAEKNTISFDVPKTAEENTISFDIPATAEENTVSFDVPETVEENTVSFDIPTEEENTVSFDAIGSTMPIPDLKLEDKFDINLDLDEAEKEDEEELFGDYETAADAVPIEKELRAALRKIDLRAIFCFFPALLITLAATPLFESFAADKPKVLLIVNIVCLALCAALNLDMFKSFGGKRGSEFAVSVSTIISLIFGVYCLLSGNVLLAQFGFIPAIGCFFGLLGKRNTAKRRLMGFCEIANGDDKFALTLIDENNGSYAIAHDAVEGEALVAVGKKTVNITRYLKNSTYPDPFSHKAYTVAFVALGVAVVAALFGFIKDSALQAFYLFTAVTAIGAPFSSALIGTLPHKLAAGRLSDYGAMLTSFAAAEEIEQTNAVVFDVNSIFPRGRVKMYDIKVLSPNNLDETILNAAAVTTSINSPLGHIFRRIARTSDDYVLPPADSVKYENRLGISGWVGDHSVLIGNRTLMETHGVSVPTIEVDRKILRSGYFPVYVASDGRPCALIIVGYETDKYIENELHRLTRTGVVLLVNNCDPNVTEEMLCDYFGLPEDFVKIMQSGSVRMYKDKTEFCESVPAKAAFSGGAEGLAAIVTSSIRIKRLTAMMAVLHILLAIAGVTAALGAVVGGMLSLITPVNIALYLAGSLIAVLLAPFFYRP